MGLDGGMWSRNALLLVLCVQGFQDYVSATEVLHFSLSESLQPTIITTILLESFTPHISFRGNKLKDIFTCKTNRLSKLSRGSSCDKENVSSKSCRKPCRSYLTMLEFSRSDKMCCILNAVSPFINLHFPFLYAVIASLKEAGMLINWAHKDSLERETVEKKKDL